jgi:uncharacterized protein YcfJ
MRKGLHVLGALAVAGSAMLSGCGGGHDSTTNNAAGDVSATPSATTPSATAPSTYDSSANAAVPTEHHSKLAGAAAGAAAGHMLGHHAVLGAAAGALIQHERNKHHQ